MATLHNEDQVKLKDMRPGDTVIVRKAGDVIPEVVGPVMADRPPGSEAWEFPSACPCPLRFPLVRSDSDAAHYCTAVQCPEQARGWIEHFAARSALDIEHLGERTVAVLMEHGLVSDVADIYTLDFAQVSRLEGFGEQSASNLLKAIEASKRKPLARLLIGLNIRHLGNSTSELLAAEFGHLDRIIDANPSEIVAVEGIGPVIADSVREFFDSEANRRIVEKLRAAGVDFGSEQPSADALPQTLAGMAVVVTGTLSGYSRDEAAAAIKARGGKSPGSVSANTAAVVVGDKPGASKLGKAETLGIPTIGEEQFGALLEHGRPALGWSAA